MQFCYTYKVLSQSSSQLVKDVFFGDSSCFFPNPGFSLAKPNLEKVTGKSEKHGNTQGPSHVKYQIFCIQALLKHIIPQLPPQNTRHKLLLQLELPLPLSPPLLKDISVVITH